MIYSGRENKKKTRRVDDAAPSQAQFSNNSSNNYRASASQWNNSGQGPSRRNLREPHWNWRDQPQFNDPQLHQQRVSNGYRGFNGRTNFNGNVPNANPGGNRIVTNYNPSHVQQPRAQQPARQRNERNYLLKTRTRNSQSQTTRLPTVHWEENRSGNEGEDQNQNNTNSDERPDGECYEGGPLKWAGHMYNPKTKKYFKMTDQHTGISGFSRQDMERKRRDKRRDALFAANRPRHASESFVLRPVVNPVSKIAEESQIGKVCRARNIRSFEESRLLSCSVAPSFVRETPCDNPLRKVMGCEFLDMSASGDKIVGCFAIADRQSRENHRLFSSMYVLNARIDERLASQQRAEKDRREDRNESCAGLNTLGLVFESAVGDAPDIDDTVTFCDFPVDMTLAPIDSDVTCVLGVSACDRQDRRTGRVMSECEVFLQPLPELSSPESYETLSSPIYNMRWRNKEIVWSIGWNGHAMLIAFGGEENTRVENVLTGRSFVMSTRKKNAITLDFSPDGNLLMMGLRGDDVIRSDLRMNGNHITGCLKGSRSTDILRQLNTAHPECVLTGNFAGELRLWDFRYPSRPLMSFKGHTNSHYRLPCFVDEDEKFVFATGSDGVTRGWSLASGDLLCAVQSPRPVEQSADFPRAVYSSRWGGRSGNAALVLAVGDSMRVHALDSMI